MEPKGGKVDFGPVEAAEVGHLFLTREGGKSNDKIQGVCLMLRARGEGVRSGELERRIDEHVF